ncbi:MAG: metal ABC transporter substrate-binding protein [Anaerolineae bacterium]|nr:metal ABC transporter substrate-binding protein [Anaerolineae bacterium]
MMRRLILFVCIAWWVPVLVACQAPAAPSPMPTSEAAKQLRVVATTSIVGDVVRQIGGDAIQLSVIVPIGADAHAYEASPQDIARVAEADLIFAVGAGLEQHFLDRLLEQTGKRGAARQLAEGIPLLAFEGHEEEHSHERERHKHKEGEAHHHRHDSEVDPHLWMDPNNVITWTHTIETALSQADPGRADLYRRNAEAYRAELRKLDEWIREQVSQIPPENRKLVTDHRVFGYFARRYGFQQVGTIIPGVSTAAEPSAQEIAKLQETIRDLNVKAIFVSSTISPSVAEQIAKDIGIPLVRLYMETLSEPGGEADSYITMMRYNVQAIVRSLR